MKQSTHPGILYNLYGGGAYTVPGPAVYGGGGPAAPSSVINPPTSAQPTQQPTQAPPAGNIQKYQQCGGNGWQGTGTCAAGLTCNKQNDYYSQCL